MRRFHDIPADEFPLNRDAYYRLRDEIGSISAGFYDLGTPDGAVVAQKLEQVHQALDHVWETISGIKRCEKKVLEIFGPKALKAFGSFAVS
ncbi:hypothetical protein [Shinella zoogloeoides]|uniref:hypothetical protein n=1 Tax=Shinella zoogloeoides TaxID=352475 RepID=UPI0028B02805|nr:hypothetical protein [Shinella zoogloeoides]